MSDFTIVQTPVYLSTDFSFMLLDQEEAIRLFNHDNPDAFQPEMIHPEVTVLHPISSVFQSPGFVLPCLTRIPCTSVQQLLCLYFVFHCTRVGDPFAWHLLFCDILSTIILSNHTKCNSGRIERARERQCALL